MATKVVQNILLTGVVPAGLTAATLGGDDFENDSKTILEVANGAGGDLALTIKGQRTLPTGVDPTKVITVPAGETRLVGPFPAAIYSRDSDGHVVVEYDDETSITIGPISLNDGFN